MSEKVERAEKVEVGSIVEGKVTKIKPFGAIVALPNNTQGLVHISHISSSFVQNISDHLAIGDVVRVKVLSADPATGKIALSMKEAKAGEPKSSNSDTPPRDSDFRPKQSFEPSPSTFEDKFKEWLKVSNERHASINKRNKRK